MSSNKIFDDYVYEQLSNLEFKSIISNVITTTRIELSDNLYTHVNMNLTMRSNKNCTLVQLTTCINPNNIIIHDFKSRIENCGFGKQVLIHFNSIIHTYNFNISYIGGHLSFRDYNHWDKIIHMYTHYIQDVEMFIGDKLSPQEFLENAFKYQNQIVPFKLLLK